MAEEALTKKAAGERALVAVARVSHLLQTLWLYRAALVVGLAVSTLLALVPQAREIYRIVAGLELYSALNFLPPLLAMTVAAVALFDSVHRAAEPGRRRWGHVRFTRVVSVLVTILPLLGLIVGLLLAANEMNLHQVFYDDQGRMAEQKEFFDLPPIQSIVADLGRSQVMVWAGASLAVLATAAAIWFQLRSAATVERKPTSRVVPILALAVFIVAVIFSGDATVAGVVGSMTLFVAFYFPVCVVLTGLTTWSSRLRLPITTVLLVILGTILVLNSPQNHRVAFQASSLPDLEESPDAFSQWLESRPDRKLYEDVGQPYPVFLVGAAGGGAFAAQFAALVLSKIQDRCPHFAQHVFAISGVSGGSIGSTLFSSLAKAYANPVVQSSCWNPDSGAEQSDRFETATRAFFEGELLDPLIAKLLFRDSLQAAVPLPLGFEDRASGWEDSLSHLWKQAAPDGGQPWDEPYLASWRPDGMAPALLLNSTTIGDASRVVAAPFKLVGAVNDEIPINGAIELGYLQRGACQLKADYPPDLQDVSLATAVSISSRFPWFMPVAEVDVCDGSVVRLVDGGYADNSGMETVRNLYEALRIPGQEADKSVAFYVISIRPTKVRTRAEPHSAFIDFLSSPAATLLGYLGRRPETAAGWFQSRYLACDVGSEEACGGGLSYIEFNLDLDDFDLPLGFALSPTTTALIDVQTGRLDAVWGSRGSEDKWQSLGGYIGENTYAAAQIFGALLQPQPPEQEPTDPSPNPD